MPQAFDFSNPPFDRLTGRELERFKACLDVALFRKGQALIRAGEVPQSFFVVIKGRGSGGEYGRRGGGAWAQ